MFRSQISTGKMLRDTVPLKYWKTDNKSSVLKDKTFKILSKLEKVCLTFSVHEKHIKGKEYAA